MSPVVHSSYWKSFPDGLFVLLPTHRFLPSPQNTPFSLSVVHFVFSFHFLPPPPLHPLFISTAATSGSCFPHPPPPTFVTPLHRAVSLLSYHSSSLGRLCSGLSILLIRVLIIYSSSFTSRPSVLSSPVSSITCFTAALPLISIQPRCLKALLACIFPY